MAQVEAAIAELQKTFEVVKTKSLKETARLLKHIVAETFARVRAGNDAARPRCTYEQLVQTVRGSAGTAAFDSPELSSPYSSSSSSSSSSALAETRAARVASHAGTASHGGTGPTHVVPLVLPTWASLPASAPPPTASEFGATLPWNKVRPSPPQPATAPSTGSAALPTMRAPGAPTRAEDRAPAQLSSPLVQSTTRPAPTASPSARSVDGCSSFSMSASPKGCVSGTSLYGSKSVAAQLSSPLAQSPASSASATPTGMQGASVVCRGTGTHCSPHNDELTVRAGAVTVKNDGDRDLYNSWSLADLKVSAEE